MNPVYEYIAAIFIMTLVVGYSLYSLNTMSTSQLNIAHEELLQPVAGRLFDKILLTSGYPKDWGADININDSTLNDFGLSSRFGEMYRMDINKVMRLVDKWGSIENPLYIQPTTMGNLTGIYENSGWNYGFSLMMKSALNINITHAELDMQGNKPIPPTNYTVDVTNYLRKYVSNVEVKAVLFFIYCEDRKDDVFEYNYSMVENLTNWQGRALLDFGNSTPQPDKVTGKSEWAYVIIVTANYYGIQSQQIEVIGSKEPALDLLIQGQYHIANFTEVPKLPHGASHLEACAIEFTSNLQLIFNDATNASKNDVDVINHGKYSYQVFKLENELSDDIIFAGLFVKFTGKWNLVLCQRPIVPVAINYTSHSYPYAGINSEIFSRLIKIGRSSYYAELTVWRMFE